MRFSKTIWQWEQGNMIQYQTLPAFRFLEFYSSIWWLSLDNFLLRRHGNGVFSLAFTAILFHEKRRKHKVSNFPIYYQGSSALSNVSWTNLEWWIPFKVYISLLSPDVHHCIHNCVGLCFVQVTIWCKSCIMVNLSRGFKKSWWPPESTGYFITCCSYSH